MDDIGGVSISEIWHRDVDELNLLLLQDLNPLLKPQQLMLRQLLSHLHHQYNQSARAVLSTCQALTGLLPSYLMKVRDHVVFFTIAHPTVEHLTLLHVDMK